MLRTHSTADQLDLVDPFLPEELGLPAECAAVDEFLDDEGSSSPIESTLTLSGTAPLCGWRPACG